MNFFAEFLSQLPWGQIHADAHGKNYLVTARAGTAWIDWGLTLNVGWKDIRNIGQLVSGLAVSSHGWTADALIAMSTASHLTGGARRRLHQDLETVLARRLKGKDKEASSAPLEVPDGLAGKVMGMLSALKGMVFNVGKMSKQCLSAMAECGIEANGGAASKLLFTCGGMLNTLKRTVPYVVDGPVDFVRWLWEVGTATASNLTSDARGALKGRRDAEATLKAKLARFTQAGVLGAQSLSDFLLSKGAATLECYLNPAPAALTAGA